MSDKKGVTEDVAINILRDAQKENKKALEGKDLPRRSMENLGKNILLPSPPNLDSVSYTHLTLPTKA